jgi:hypothetical protein
MMMALAQCEYICDPIYAVELEIVINDKGVHLEKQ